MSISVQPDVGKLFFDEEALVIGLLYRYITITIAKEEGMAYYGKHRDTFGVRNE